MIRSVTRTIACVAILTACNQPERLGDSAPVDPRRTTPQIVFESVELDPQVLESHADYDKFEDAVIARSGASLVYMLYKEAMVRKRGDQRTFMRWMVLAYRDELGKEYREPLQKFMGGLTNNSDMSDDVRYLVGFVAWMQLIGGPGQPNAPLKLNNPALADTVIKAWGDLVARAPSWVGPHGIDAPTLTARVEALRMSIGKPGLPRDPAPPESSTLATTVGSAVNAAYGAALEKPGWEERLGESDKAFEDFHRVYEDKGQKKACERVAAALKAVDDPTRLGEGPAHCSLNRGDPYSAIDQVRRMVIGRVAGGIPAVLARIEVMAENNKALDDELTALRFEVAAAAKAAPRWASRSGLTPAP